MEVAVTPSVSPIEGVSAKAFTEGLHCDVLELFIFAFRVRVSSRTGLGSAERRPHGLPKVFTEGSIHVSETGGVIDCEGGLVIKTGVATSFMTA